MSGSPEQGKNAARTNKERYGPDYYKMIGARGGKKSKSTWLKDNPDKAREIGAMGGRKSKRRPKKVADRG